MPLQADEDLILTIEKPVAGGRMLARHDGQVIFVAGAIPGERVRARIERASKSLAFAVATDVLDASPDRRPGDVDWACGGALFAHVGYERQIRLKAELIADAFERIGKIALPAPVDVMRSEERGYRMRARLHAAQGRLGFFREGTHELCPPGPTQQLLPETVQAVAQIEQLFTRAGGAALRSCEISENAQANERTVLVELESLDLAPANVASIAGVTGLLFAAHQSTHAHVAYGSPYVTDRLDSQANGATLTHHVQSFFQANRYLFAELAARAAAHVPSGRVLDLYAGVGLFAVSLAARGHDGIVAVEGDRASARDLDANAAPYRGAIRTEHSSVEAFLRRRYTEAPDTVILDPPRTGVSREAMASILALKASRIVYVSCDTPTLARDVRRFREVGYALSHIEAFDLFPNTPHVEVLAVLVRH